METVVVVISTYNGEKNIIKQLDSIFAQEGVNVSVYIRDDGSKDRTMDVVKKYSKDNPTHKIVFTCGKNMGYAKSFWTALCECGKSDYYAFSDQDDVWMPNKLLKSIEKMKKDEDNVPKLAYCNMARCDEERHIYDEQVNILKPNQLSKKIVLTQTYNYGAATVINNEARDLICRCWPDVDDLPHDLWAGLIVYWFGKIYYVDDKLYYWIRYDTSVTGEGTKNNGIKYRIKKTFNKKSYVNVTKYLLENYIDVLEKNDRYFLYKVVNYKSNLKYRLNLLMDNEFKRISFMGTCVLKLGILFGWY